MQSLIRKIQANRVFKFASSVRLAVPLMLVIAGVVAAGTLYESRYNAQVAKIVVYQTWWFQTLMGLLWTNIFCATLSRYPFKHHQTGFVVTHIGLLTLLIGAELTSLMGIDGQLRIIEGQASNQVFLDDLVVKVGTTGAAGATPIQTIHLKRSLEPKTGNELGLGRVRELTGANIDNYLPFVTMQQKFVAGGANPSGSGVAVSFTLNSQFFNVNQILDSVNQPELQMGPAHLRLIVDGNNKSGDSSSSKPVQHQANREVAAADSKDRVLIVKDASSGSVVQQIPVVKLKQAPVSVHGIKVTLIQVYEQAVVSANKLTEQGKPGANPALELRVEHQGQALREVTFEKFPDFSLNAKGDFGLRFQYQSGSAAPVEAEQNIPMHGRPDAGAPAPTTPMGGAGGGNLIEFQATPKDLSSIRIALFKNGSQVMTQTAKAGETVQTPWMGMKITIDSIGSASASEQVVKPTEMQPKLPLPPSAIFVRSDIPGSDGAWLVEGDARTLKTTRGTYEIYYGPDSITLPFDVKLDRFRKVDYPGTETAMSFESEIRLNGGGAPIRIQMNEPLQHEGYLLYQSSYEMGQGMPTASIFSVNHDPGRWIKYIGAIILVLGIALFTVMRSKWYTNYRRNQGMKTAATVASLLLFLLAPLARADSNGVFKDLSPQAATDNMMAFAKQVDSSAVASLPVHSNGRVKPLDSFARETILFLSGKYSMWGLDSVQLMLGLSVSNATAYVPIINIRDPDLRVTLGFPKSQRWVTLQEISQSPLQAISAPVLEKNNKNEKLLTPDDKKIIEVVQQAWLLRQILTGQYLTQSMILDVGKESGAHAASSGLIMEKAQRYLDALRGSDFASARMAALELLPIAKTQPMPELFQSSIPKLETEVLYNHVRPFFWVGIFYVILGVLLASGLLSGRLTPQVVFMALALPALTHAMGFVARVYITGFAPVTSMYGTMVWMAFGVVIFGSVLFGLYRNALVFGLLLIGSGSTLLLTESIPLILSPEMDPIVAVLRNNFWLTIHVLTISISYAAFTIAMLIGNTGLVQTVLKKDTVESLRSMAHLAYRATQLGVFLLTAGIILGGWWADYSWGRFWGWDPKETWALIADLGFIAILHARYVGWLDVFGILAACPIAYLLVVMAWYGVNFILAAGLHSYGFSSGGATIVETLVGVQLMIFAAGIAARRMRNLSSPS